MMEETGLAVEGLWNNWMPKYRLSLAHVNYTMSNNDIYYDIKRWLNYPITDKVIYSKLQTCLN